MSGIFFQPVGTHDTDPFVDPPQGWHNLAILSGIPETEFIALPWKCEYCGLVHLGDRLRCWDGVNGCGAPKPGCEEPPRGVLQLCPKTLGYLSEIEQEPRPLLSEWLRFYPEPTMRVVSHPGKTAKEHKQEIRARLASAFQKAIKGALSLC